jgi:hypothetical protein
MFQHLLAVESTIVQLSSFFLQENLESCVEYLPASFAQFSVEAAASDGGGAAFWRHDKFQRGLVGSSSSAGNGTVSNRR